MSRPVELRRLKTFAQTVNYLLFMLIIMDVYLFLLYLAFRIFFSGDIFLW